MFNSLDSSSVNTIAQFGLRLDSLDGFSIPPGKILEGNATDAILATSHVTSVPFYTGSSKFNVHRYRLINNNNNNNNNKYTLKYLELSHVGKYVSRSNSATIYAQSILRFNVALFLGYRKTHDMCSNIFRVLAQEFKRYSVQLQFHFYNLHSGIESDRNCSCAVEICQPS